MRKEVLTDTKYVPGSLKSCACGQDLIKEIKRYGIAAQGRAELITHLQGKQLTRNQAIRAECFSCMGWYADGKADCRQPECPLYPFMPYAPKKKAPAAPVQGLPAKNGHAPDRLDVPKPGAGP